MSLPNAVNNQLLFLIAEVCSQLQSLQLLVSRRSTTLSQQAIDRAGYSYNLKLRVHAECLHAIRSGKNKDIVTLRAVENIATTLENIASLCQDCTRQLNQLEHRQFLKKFSYKKWLHKIELALQKIDQLLKTKDTDKALKIGALQDKVTRFYRSTTKELIKSLKNSKSAEDIVTALFIARHIQEMSAAVLEISEAIISVNVGQAMPIERYRALRALIEGLDLNDDWRSLNVESLADTRSGSAISGVIDSNVKDKNKDKPYLAVFKDGQTHKVLEERQGVMEWHKLYPGIAPQILSQHTEGDTSALMIEHLAGDTIEKIILNGSDKAMYKALKYLTKTLTSIWDSTQQKGSIPAKHCQQLLKRLTTVYGLHPEFETMKLADKTMSVLLEQAQKIEQKLTAPFSVYIHGDLNVDNIIVDRQQRRVYFIDLHRSRHMDYVQDIAVFMVSNYRLPVTDVATRKRIHHIIERFYLFACDYAQRHHDKTFQLRLALGLARSFASSTRFTLDKPLANRMFSTALHLLNLVVKTPIKKQHEFSLSIKDILNVDN